ncbi:MAG: 50S ribosomal protein L20 [Methylacidiphilales bacterium]|nr:50S ribosomal protein L20 [Candidatus Methylacidiphilales bacterium]
MPRATSAVSRKSTHKKILKKAKGYRGQRSTAYRVAKQAVIKSGQYSYRDRKQKKRQFRSLWIVRLNAAVRKHGVSYSQFINGLKITGIELDRKVLSELSIRDELAFSLIISQVKKSLTLA